MTPYNYPKLLKACRAIEQKYGLAVDRGVEPDVSPSQLPKLPPKIRTAERHSGQESLYSYIQRLKPELMARLESAATWTDTQTVFLEHGLVLKLAGNGLAIKDRHGTHSIKASDLDRTISKAKLEVKFGPFQAPSEQLLHRTQSDKRYTGVPLHMGADRQGLYAKFRQELVERQRQLDEIRRQEQIRRHYIKDKWARKREAIRRVPMLQHDRQHIMEQIKRNERDEYSALFSHILNQKMVVRAERPYTSWAKYLQHQATQGLEAALTILRSDNVVAGPKPLGNQLRVDQRLEVLEHSGLSDKHRRGLLAIIKMREVLDVLDKTGYMAQSLKYVIDAKGTIIFSLPEVGNIRDTGRMIYFSVHAEKAEVVAEKYALARWGQAKRDGNKFGIDLHTQEHNETMSVHNIITPGRSANTR